EHAPHDLGIDLRGRLGQTEFVVHVAGPLRRAHAHHVRLRAVEPAAAPFSRDVLFHLGPDVLGVEEHTVEVEDDGVDGAHARVTASRSTAAADASPARPNVRSKSALVFRMTSRTPSSPPTARPHTYGRPRPTADAPSARARMMSAPERTPLSSSTSTRPPTASTTPGSTSMVAIAPSTWRPPWLETTTPSIPYSTAAIASAGC